MCDFTRIFHGRAVPNDPSVTAGVTSRLNFIRFSWAKLWPELGLFGLEKTASTIQHGHGKHRTHAQMFSQTLEHGNSKNEIR